MLMKTIFALQRYSESRRGRARNRLSISMYSPSLPCKLRHEIEIEIYEDQNP
ncbi:hypothetical protein Scep_027318 [Stephania cephalantha]|uniref:Uncharacterized protein n=1 Tax=Stephania cephalantha TaxID=152367 RepID=A0AAP0E7S6_9MAGN